MGEAVINWKLSAILGGVGMVLSMIVGLLSGAGFPYVLLRALIFAGVFFGIGCGVWLLITNFLPELLFPENGKNEQSGTGGSPGSRINILLDDEKILPEMYQRIGNGEDVGDIGELLNGTFKPPPPERDNSVTEIEGIDQMPEDGYTGNRSQTGQLPADFPDVVPDLEVVTGPLFDGGDEKPEDFTERLEPARSPTGNKAQPLKGDFNAKDIAAGIRTILNKDK